MKRSGVDGFGKAIADREPITSEVYVTVISDRRVMGSIGWKHVALAIAILAVSAAILVVSLTPGGAGSGRRVAPSVTLTPSAISSPAEARLVLEEARERGLDSDAERP